MNETTHRLIKAFAICLAIFIIVSIINTIVYFASNIFSVNNDINMNEDYSSEIKNIKIDMGTSNLIIKKGDTLNVIADNVSKRFKVNEESDTLTIKEKSVNVFINKSISKVIITIPNNLKDLSIDFGAVIHNLQRFAVKHRLLIAPQPFPVHIREDTAKCAAYHLV